MTFSEPSMRLPNSNSRRCKYAILAVNAVNRRLLSLLTDGVRPTDSPSISKKPQSSQQLQAVAPAENAGRRIGAGAGATPVFVAIVRHDTSAVRSLSLAGSLPHLPLFLQLRNEA